MKRFICLVAICLVAPLFAHAQDSAANPLTATLRKQFDDYAKNLVATAETMPEEKYSFKPTPENMTFGKTIGHIADVNNAVCSKLFTAARHAVREKFRHGFKGKIGRRPQSVHGLLRAAILKNDGRQSG